MSDKKREIYFEGNRKVVGRKTKGNYIFPNVLGKVMSMVSQRTQFESSLMSISVILAGLMLSVVYTVFFTQMSSFIKIMAVVNGLAALVFLSSMMISQFQSYRHYLASVELLQNPNENEKVDLSSIFTDEEKLKGE